VQTKRAEVLDLDGKGAVGVWVSQNVQTVTNMLVAGTAEKMVAERKMQPVAMMAVGRIGTPQEKQDVKLSAM
jgi:hypothetical protein